ncbi:MAG: patatin-like phospholipase family protein, partial [Kiritimatiellae bacterium]|nr:patatin-like phospholipase family protein [Kiritimatiellia bacterium]
MTSVPHVSKVRIGLALGSGGARGWAHLGVLRALGELRIPVYCVAGTSIGALVGAVFASGNTDLLCRVVLELDWKKVIHYFLELTFPRSGLIDGVRVVEFLKEHVRAVDIQDLGLPFAAVATDLRTGEEIVIREGNVVEAVRASIAIPGMFTPVVRDDAVLVDGGLVNPLPVSVVRALGAEQVIAVDLTAHPALVRSSRNEKTRARQRLKDWTERVAAEHRDNPLLKKFSERLRRFKGRKFAWSRTDSARTRLPGIFEVLGSSIRIVERQITIARLRIEPADVLIQPEVQSCGFMDY